MEDREQEGWEGRREKGGSRVRLIIYLLGEGLAGKAFDLI